MSANRGLKNRTAISTAIENDTYRRLKEHSTKTGIPMSKIFDKAICMYLASIEDK